MSDFPAIRPTLNLNFARSKQLDPRVTFRRASTGTYVDADGLIKTAGINVPRFDHDPVTGVCKGLLVEEQRTNSIRNNTMVGAVAGTPGTLPTNWAYAVADSGLTSSVVGTGIENGISYIDYRVNGIAASVSALTVGIDYAAAATGQTWTASSYLKLAAGSASGIASWNILLTETTSAFAFVSQADYPVSTPTATFVRSSATRTLSGGATVAYVGCAIRVFCTNGAAIDFTLRIGLPQIEQGAVATSVIPTSTAAATRSADLASMTGTNFSSWYNQSEGSFFSKVSILSPFTQGNTDYGIWLGAGSNTADAIRHDYAQNANDSLLQVYPSPLIVVGFSGSVTSTTRAAASAYKAASFGFSLNGRIGQFKSNTSYTSFLTNVDRLFLTGRNGVGGQNKTISRIAYWPKRLPDAQLQALTRR